MTPDDIIARVVESYACREVYQDQGLVHTSSSDTPIFDERIAFHTAFMRPDRFRFEFRYRYHMAMNHKRFVIAANGDDVKVMWDGAPRSWLERRRSLPQAIAAATGLSAGASRIIPSLLFRANVFGERPTDLDDVVSLGEQALDGIRCHRLAGVARDFESLPFGASSAGGRADQRDILWIEQDSLLIRRIERAIHLGSSALANVVDLHPDVGALSPGALEL